MALPQNLTPQDLALAVDGEPRQPVTVEQQKISPSVTRYMLKFVQLFPHFSWNTKLDRNNALHEMERIWPKVPGFGTAARRLQESIAEVISAAPISNANSMVLVRIWAVSSRSQASLSPVKSVPQPHEPVVIAPFDGAKGVRRRYFVPVFDELPTFDDMSIETGLMVLCQAVPPLISQFVDNRPVGYGGGPGTYRDRTNHDKILTGNDVDTDQIVEMPLGATYYMNLPIPHPPAIVPPWETSPTLLSSQVMAGAASMAALGMEESTGKTPEQRAEARENDQVNRAAHRQQEQTVAAVTREASPSLLPVMGVAGIAGLAQNEAAAQTGILAAAPQGGAPQTEFGEAPTRPILRDLPAQDDTSLSPTDRAQVELQLEQESVREAQDAGEITPAEAIALDRMPNAYEREERLEAEEQRHLPEAYLEGDEPNLRAAGQEIMTPEGAAATESGGEEADNTESNAPGEPAELAAEQGGPVEAASGAEETNVSEALSGAQGEVLGGTTPESEVEPVSELTEPSIGDETQQAAAEITGEPGGIAEPQPGAVPVLSGPESSESPTSELATSQGEAPSIGSPEGEAPTIESSAGEPQEPQELSTSPDEVTEPQANATVPEPVHVSAETRRQETPDLDTTKTEASMQDVKEEIDQARDQVPEPDIKPEQHGLDQHGSDQPGGDRQPEVVQGRRDDIRDEQPRSEDQREGRREESNLDGRSDERDRTVHIAGIHHPSPNTALEQVGNNFAHQLDQMHHMHEAMESNSLAPHMRSDVSMIHGTHPPDAYRSLEQGGPAIVSHNPALSTHALTPPVIVSAPLQTGHMVQRMQPAVHGRGVSSVNPVVKNAARIAKAGMVPAASITAVAALKKEGKKLAPSKVTAKPTVKVAPKVKPSGQSKRQTPINNGPIKAGDLPAPEPGGT